jgi:hypothetical protein
MMEVDGGVDRRADGGEGEEEVVGRMIGMREVVVSRTGSKQDDGERKARNGSQLMMRAEVVEDRGKARI